MTCAPAAAEAFPSSCVDSAALSIASVSEIYSSVSAYSCVKPSIVSCVALISASSSPYAAFVFLIASDSATPMLPYSSEFSPYSSLASCIRSLYSLCAFSTCSSCAALCSSSFASCFCASYCSSAILVRSSCAARIFPCRIKASMLSSNASVDIFNLPVCSSILRFNSGIA